MARPKKADKRKYQPAEDKNSASSAPVEKLNGNVDDEDFLTGITSDHDDSSDGESGPDSEAESGDLDGENDDVAGESDDLDAESVDLDADSDDLNADSDDLGAESDDAESDDLDAEDGDYNESENDDDSDSVDHRDESSNGDSSNDEQNNKEDINVNIPTSRRLVKESSSKSRLKNKSKKAEPGPSKVRSRENQAINHFESLSIKGKSQSETKTESKPNSKLVKQRGKKTANIAGKSLTTVATSEGSVPNDEYNSDTSDEEDIRNTVGNIPMNWYDEYSHLGYNWDGKKILKPEKGDELDTFLKRMEDPNFWRTVKDPQTGQDVILCDADVDMIERLRSQKVPDAQFDDYAPWIEWFTSEVMKTPVRKFPEHKRSFLPSKSEREKVGKIVHALKMGWIKPRREEKKKKDDQPQFYMLWQTDDAAEEMRRIHNHIPAPKRLLPGHAESYNPPAEYLFDDREKEEWEKLKETPSKRKLHYVPQKYASLREVPAYPRFIKERFLRCLDLYLCPRARKLRLTIEPEDLVPQLPSPKDLQPFPTVQSIVYKGHTDMIRSITVEPKGQYLVSGSDDMTIKVWEISTGRCVRTIPVGGVVRSVSWCPNQALSLVAVAADRKVLIINPGVGDHLVSSKTDTLLEEAPEQGVMSSERVKSAVSWEQATGENWEKGIRIIINHFKEVKQVTWHGRGDYFATVMPDGQNRSVLIHQLSQRRSQVPFSKSKGLVQCVMFHPIRPYFFVATQRNIRIYDLAKQELFKKLLSNSKWISSMAIHPAGDNILVGTYDRKMLWFDLDLSTQPYQSLRFHGTAVRGVAYHKRYPLFASGSDDKNLIICHGMVYKDLLQNPLIVPLKRLSNHTTRNDFGIFDVVFHPTQPWVFSSGGDATVRLYT